ncbi:MAG: EamA family transporter [Rhizobiaceae bacterium]|nr:EamA family transporter [Rhizobiaceae bacterium]
MIAFAANSVFARLALADAAIDPSSYSLVRLASGALILSLLTYRAGLADVVNKHGSLVAAFALFIYAAGFSFAYLALDTGMGALILFACVQATMIGWSVFKGDRPSSLEWLGLVVAFAAFVGLVSPGLTAPDPLGTILMVAAGIAWGVYSLIGRGAENPLLNTAGNFILAVPMAIALLIVFSNQISLTPFGAAMAIASGALTSALGYALWYRCLRQLTATKAAVVQLTVPAIATLGGIIFSAEVLTLRLGFFSILILGGVAITILAKQKRL